MVEKDRCIPDISHIFFGNIAKDAKFFVSTSIKNNQIKGKNIVLTPQEGVTLVD